MFRRPDCTGIGATGSIVVGLAIYGKPNDPVRILRPTPIVAGIVGLDLIAPVEAGKLRDQRSLAKPDSLPQRRTGQAQAKMAASDIAF